MRKFIYLTFILLFTTHSYAMDKSPARDLIVSFGNLCEHINSYQKNTAGDKNLCDFKPIFSLALDYPVNDKFSLYPQLSSGIPKKSRDKNISKLTYSALINVLYGPHEIPLKYFLGTGIFFTRLSGKGSTVILNNGMDLEEFQLPGKARVATNWIVNMGINYKFHPLVSGELYSYIYNIETSQDRSFSLGFNFNYHLGEVL